MVLNSHAEVQWYATNVHPMSIATTFLCVFFSYNFINSLSTDNIFAETHKGLKRVIIHFRKYHIWKEKKRQLTNQALYTT